MSRTLHYKTIQGLIRQSQYGTITVSNVICGRFFHKQHGWMSFKLSDDALKAFTDGVCTALNMRDKDDVLYNIKRSRIENCGILDRIRVVGYKGKLCYEYVAGQDYPYETRIVRKLLRCK